MSILIKGMEMPQGNSTINVLIYADGTVYTGHVNDSRYSAVSVPTPHGRLIDADRLDCLSWYDTGGYFEDGVLWVLNKVDELPTIIDAEGREE